MKRSIIKPGFFFVFITCLLLLNSVFAQENSCVDCHKKPETVSKLPVWNHDIFENWSASIHGINKVTCEKCMGGDPTKSTKELAHKSMKNASHPESLVYYKNIPETCGNCHENEYRKFTQSEHYKKLQMNTLSPECSTCHGSHSITLVEPLEVTKKCSLCHNEEMGILPSVPREAENILGTIQDTKIAVAKAKNAIEEGKNKNVDMSDTESILNRAETILKNSGESWHTFKIYEFEEELLEAVRYADRAYNLANALTENSCVSCHKTLPVNTTAYKKYSEWLDSSHADKGINCDKCHGGVAENASSAHIGVSVPDTVEIYNLCWKCHKNHQYFDSKHWKKLIETLETNSEMFPHGVSQDKIASGEQILTGPECSTCHGTHSIKGAGSIDSPIYYKNIPETCGLVCHKNEYLRFTRSKHYIKLKADKLAPECVTCHGSMAISVLNASAISNLCSICHNPEQGVYPDVPKDAESVLLLFDKVKGILDDAQNSIKIGRGERDVKNAENTLARAKLIFADVKDSWHEFNLVNVKEGLVKVEALGTTAKQEAEGTVMSPIKYLLIVLAIFVVIYLALRKLPGH